MWKLAYIEPNLISWINLVTRQDIKTVHALNRIWLSIIYINCELTTFIRYSMTDTCLSVLDCSIPLALQSVKILVNSLLGCVTQASWFILAVGKQNIFHERCPLYLGISRKVKLPPPHNVGTFIVTWGQQWFPGPYGKGPPGPPWRLLVGTHISEPAFVVVI